MAQPPPIWFSHLEYTYDADGLKYKSYTRETIPSLQQRVSAEQKDPMHLSASSLSDPLTKRSFLSAQLSLWGESDFRSNAYDKIRSAFDAMLARRATQVRSLTQKLRT